MNICLLQCSNNNLFLRLKNEFPQHNIFEIDNDNGIFDKIKKSQILIVGRSPHIDSSFIAKLENCILIIRDGIGYDNIEIKSAEKAHIKVFNMPDYCVNDVAEHTLAMLLSFARNLKMYCNDTSVWGNPNYTTLRMSGKRFGIVGYGRIGKRVANISAAIGMHVSFFDPFCLSSFPASYIRYETINDLFKNNDVVSLHLPLTCKTNGIINNAILKYASNLILINNARGKLINYTDLYDALNKGNVLAYLSDVMDREPPIDNCIYNAFCDTNNPIHNKITLTPHIAFSSDKSILELENNIVELLKTFRLPTCVFKPISSLNEENI